jgi:hypothetical protein
VRERVRLAAEAWRSRQVRRLGLVGILVLLAGIALASRGAVAQERDPLPVPDLPGFRTLKGDFHLHTVFSDGEVWPTVHVWEAWRDGLDVIALTDHVEYRPHASDVGLDLLRPYDLARPLADELGMILVPGVEITRPAPGTPAVIPIGSGHFNALFVTDPNALEVESLQEALRRARAQGAFVIWDHPGFMGTLEPLWHPHVEEAHREGLFQGIELVNGKDFYPEAFPWVSEKKLTILASSDAHRPIPPRPVGRPRAITLVFARQADAEGIREALEARRTAAWLGDDVWGAAEHLRGLWQGALDVVPSRLTGRPGRRLVVRARNGSAIPFRLQPRSGPEWLRLDSATLEPRVTSLLYLHVASDAPAGLHHVVLQIAVTNFHTAPGQELTVTVPLEITVNR